MHSNWHQMMVDSFEFYDLTPILIEKKKPAFLICGTEQTRN